MKVIKVDIAKYQEIKSFYTPYFTSKKGEYVDFVASFNDLIITGYNSKHQFKKITFQGYLEETEANKWGVEILKNKVDTTKSMHWIDLNSQIGSDEVGVGDFLLPMIVVATYLKKEDISLLKELGVKDSKKLSDDKILIIGEKLIQNIEYSKLTLSNEKYNEMIAKGENINSLKAKMHNRALCNLKAKHQDIHSIYVDQFVSKEKFYQYLDDPNEIKISEASFRTKGESLFPSVAAASVIARFAFLKEIEILNKKYQLNFPLGAGTNVDKFSLKFIKKYGMDEFNKIAKRNFANYKKLI